MLVVWWPRTSNGDAPAAQRRELRALSLIIFAVLGVFALTGTTRTDGWSYNQRYFLELVPLAAVGFGWAVGRAASRRRELLMGAGLGSLLALVVLLRPPEAPVRHLALLYVPLALAALLALSWTADRSEGRRALALAAGVGLAWALVVHLGDDLRGSRSLRRSNQIRLQAIAPSVGTPAGIFTFWGNKDALGPLLLDNDVVVADCFADRGATAAELRTAFHERSRRVFVITPFPRDLFARLRGDRAAVVHSPLVVEILPTRAVPTRSGLDTAPASSRIGP
jgi:hypothetical protein